MRSFSRPDARTSSAVTIDLCIVEEVPSTKTLKRWGVADIPITNASDATYIAQLLGRMVRTPMQMHITVDEVLNDVHLFFASSPVNPYL